MPSLPPPLPLPSTHNYLFPQSGCLRAITNAFFNYMIQILFIICNGEKQHLYLSYYCKHYNSLKLIRMDIEGELLHISMLIACHYKRDMHMCNIVSCKYLLHAIICKGNKHM